MKIFISVVVVAILSLVSTSTFAEKLDSFNAIGFRMMEAISDNITIDPIGVRDGQAIYPCPTGGYGTEQECRAEQGAPQLSSDVIPFSPENVILYPVGFLNGDTVLAIYPCPHGGYGLEWQCRNNLGKPITEFKKSDVTWIVDPIPSDDDSEVVSNEMI